MIQIRSKGFRNFSAFLSQPKLLDTPSFIFFDKYTKVYREVKGKTKNNNKVLYGRRDVMSGKDGRVINAGPAGRAGFIFACSGKLNLCPFFARLL